MRYVSDFVNDRIEMIKNQNLGDYISITSKFYTTIKLWHRFISPFHNLQKYFIDKLADSFVESMEIGTCCCVHSLPSFFASLAPLVCLIFCHLECPAYCRDDVCKLLVSAKYSLFIWQSLYKIIKAIFCNKCIYILAQRQLGANFTAK